MEAILPSQSTIRTLQKDVIDLLKQVSALMQRASVSLESDAAREKYVGFQEEINSAAKNVKELELRMAIVAPMKAGKSTIINAIVGQDLLPSRNAAMTTLPTEIIFNAELSEPTLTLSDELLHIFQKTYASLKRKLQAMTPEQIHGKIAPYPHLLELLQEIRDAIGYPSQHKISGHEVISRALSRLNDIIRLSSLIEPLKNPLEQLTELPRIETPFRRSQQAEQTEWLGHLVIIDTPGPNEAGENLRLSEIVNKELKNSSIVLIVLDFNQLKTEAAEKVKKEVQKVVELRGKGSLYVLVNKVDQRSEGDMTTAEVKQFVVAEFSMIDLASTNRVFEVSARRAFYATNFDLELQQLQQATTDEIKLDQMKTARTLARQSFGDMWEERFDEATVDEMKSASQFVWKKSGFQPFLENAISALMQNAAPRCMRTALELSSQHLATLRKEVKVRVAGMAKESEALEEEIEQLRIELEQLEECRKSRLQRVNQIKAKLQIKLDSIFAALQQEALVDLKEYFGRQRTDAIKTTEPDDFIRRAGMEFKWLFEIFQGKSSVDAKHIKFNTASEAEDCVNLTLLYAKQKVERLLNPRRLWIEKEVKKSCRDLIANLENDTKGITERACKRLNRTFDVDLFPPPMPAWNPLEFEKVQAKHGTEQRTTYQSRKERPWYFLWLIEVETKVPVTHTDTYYTVSLDELVETNNQSIKKSLNHISQELMHYLDGDFQACINSFFDALDSFFKDYQKILAQSQKDTMLNHHGQAKLKKELDELIKETSHNADQVTRNVGFLDSLDSNLM